MTNCACHVKVERALCAVVCDNLNEHMMQQIWRMHVARLLVRVREFRLDGHLWLTWWRQLGREVKLCT